MRILLIATFFILSACATTENYERKLDSWIGSSESALVSQWGAPASTYQMDGGKVLSYQYSGGVSAYGTPVYGSYIVNAVNNYCNTDFFIENGVISKWRWQGNMCKSE